MVHTPRLTWIMFLFVVAGLYPVLPALAAPAPTVTSITPPYALNTAVAAIQVWGTGFLGVAGSYNASNPTITLRRTGYADISAGGASVYLFAGGTEIGINNFPLTGAAVGVWDVVVTNNDGQSATLPGAFTVIASYPTPTVTAITPNSAPNTGPVNVTITGTNFFVPPAPGGPVMTATLTHGTPYGSIAGSSVTVVSSTQMTATFNITGAGWGASSPWNVVVRQPSSGPSATLTNGFAVTVGGPTVTAISPNTGTNTAGVSVTITGTGFLGVSGYNAGNPSVTLRKSGQTDRTVANGSVYFTNSTQISCTLPITGAATGAWDVIVTDWDGQSSTLPSGFTVYANPKPTVTGITPSSGVNSGSVAITNLAGTGFLAGATVKLTAAGQPDIPGTSVVVVSATKITCNFDLSGTVAGSRDVTVTIPDGQAGTRANGFTVYNPAPVVTAISPNSAANNTTVDATITGAGFAPGATAKLGGFTGTNVTVVSDTQITASFAIALPATGGGSKLDVVVTNPGGLPGTLAAAFTVIYPAPVITSISPPYALNTGVAALVVTGTGFMGSPGNYHASNPTLKLRKAGSSDISQGGASIYLYPSATQIGTNNFPLTGASVGVWDVIVTNSDGQSATLPAAFTVYSSYGTPTITGITPNSAPNTGPVDVTITGTSFFVPPAPGGPVMTVKLGHSTPYGSIAATNVVVANSTTMTCTFNITGAGWGAASPWNLTVQQPSSGPSATLPNAFAVTVGGPTVTAISPSSGVNTAGVSATITGTGFLGVSGYNAGNPSVTLRKAGQTDKVVANGSVYFTNSGQISCTLPITGAAIGAWDVIVTNWDGQSSTLPAGFTVYNAKPTLTSITPNNGTNDGSVAITNLAGSGFVAGMTITLSKTGQTSIPGASVVIVSATKATCTFDITGTALGAWDVVAANPGSQNATLAGAFTVNHGAATSLTLTPANQTVVVGDVVTYTATAQDAHGDTWDATAATAFSSDVNAGGSWATNKYTTAKVGDWTIGGNYGGVLGVTSLHVTHGAATSLTLTPDPGSVVAGGTVTYTATAQDALGNPWDVTAATSFSIDAGAGGSWLTNVYTSANAGAWTVTGNYGGISGTARLNVTHGAPTLLFVTPNPDSVTAGTAVTYAATAMDAQGNPWDATADTTFTIDAAAGGSWAANKYSSANAGTWTVTGNDAGIIGTATLLVGPSTATRLTITPNPGSATAGSPITYTATAQDAQGNSWDATATTAFSITAGAGGSWAANVYTPAKAGVWTVTGTFATLTGTASLTVAHAAATQLTLTPNPDSVTSGTAVTYTATAQDAQGNTWDVSATTAFAITAGAGGSWAANKYTAGNAGTWTVTGTLGAVQGTASLTVHYATALAVTNVTGNPKQVVQLSAKLAGPAGVMSGRSVSFTVAGVAAGSAATNSLGVAISPYTIPAGMAVGPATITAQYAGDATYAPSTGTGTLTVSPPTPVSLTLTLSPASVVSGATTTCRVVGNNAFDYTSWCIYAIQTGAGGSWGSNVYTSSKSGTWTITATYRTLRATANLKVSAGAVATVTLTPATATINPTATQIYTVKAADAAGNTWTPPATCLSHNGTGSFTGYVYRPGAGDAGHAVTITATVAPAPVTTATLNVNAPMGIGNILGWDKDTQKFYLCSNASNPQTGMLITGTGTFNGIPCVMSGSGTNITVTAGGASLRMSWTRRLGILTAVSEYSTGTSAGAKTATYNGARTVVNGVAQTGFWGLTHTIVGGVATYGVAHQ